MRSHYIAQYDAYHSTPFLQLMMNFLNFLLGIFKMSVMLNEELYELYQECDFKKSDGKREKAKVVLEKLNKKLQLDNHDMKYSKDEKNRVKKIMDTFERRTKLNLKKENELERWNKECFVELVPRSLISEEDNEEEQQPLQQQRRTSGRPKLLLSDKIHAKTENSILDSILDEIKVHSDQQKISVCDLLKRLLTRAEETFPDDVQEEKVQSMPIDASTALVYNLDISLNQYQELRLILKKYSFDLPIRNSVDAFKKTLLPPITSEEIKAYCDVTAMIKQTVSSLFELNDISPIVSTIPIDVKAKFGLDGSGSHQVRHQNVNGEKESEECESSYIGSYWCPLKIRIGDVVVWQNPLPNSIVYARPICIMRAKETRDVIKEHFKPFMDVLHGLESEPVPLQLKVPSIPMKIHTEISMIDGKMADILQGDSGAFCHYCTVTREEANNIDRIQAGFRIEKDFETISATWEKLESGEIGYTNPERKGQCHEPLLKRSLRFYGNTHQKLRSLDHCLKILYHLASGQTHTWSERDWRVKDALDLEKETVIQTIREKTGLLYDKPTQGGGNTNTGRLAEKFFKPKRREAICSTILNKKDRKNFSQLLSLYNQIIQVCQHVDSSKLAIVDKVKELGTQVMLFEKSLFPWVYIFQTVHSMCGHLYELFELNGGSSIAVYAEQSSEAWNKHIRGYKSGVAAKARQLSVKVNLLDIFNRIMIRTHPLIVSHIRQLSCSRCKKFGHTIRSCPLRFSSVKDYEQFVVDSCFHHLVV